MKDRDIAILGKIIKYANEINIAIVGLNFENFLEAFIIKNSVSMCILQIGELASKLSNEFKSDYNQMPWRDIVNMRHRVAHAYDSVDMEILWNIATVNIPELKEYCERITP